MTHKPNTQLVNKKPVTRENSTVQKYAQLMNLYDDLDLENPIEAFEDLKTREKPNGATLSSAYIHLIMNAMLWKYRNDGGDNEEIIKRYNQIIKKIRITKDEHDKKNETEKDIILFEEIVKRREYYATRNELYHVVLSLYSYLPPRRLKDYVIMRLLKNKETKLYEEFNYFDLATNTFIFNNYKSKKAYGTQRIQIPENNKLKSILLHFIEKNKVKNNEPLLGISYPQLRHILYVTLGCGVDDIRHSFVNNEFKNVQNMPSSQSIEDNAIAMAHNPTMHLRYRKVKK